MSNCGWFIVVSVQLTVVAMWLARSPIEYDLSCGFQLNLSSGTRSSTRRVASISWSYSGSSNSAIVMSVPPRQVGRAGRAGQVVENTELCSLDPPDLPDHHQSTIASMNQPSVSRSRKIQ